MSQPSEHLTESDVRGQRSPDNGVGAGSGGGESRMVGWVLFAGVIMILVGAFEAIVGLTALVSSGYFEVTQDPLVTDDLDIWGWTHLVLGGVAVAAGFGLFRGKLWARIIGILFSLVIAVVNIGFVSFAPILSVIIIAMSVICVFAITVHGEELREW
jgi:hypothetical protein